MAGPTKQFPRIGRERLERQLTRSFLEQWRMGRPPQGINETVMDRFRVSLSDIPSLPMWMVEELARAEANERMRRSTASYRDRVEKPSRRKAGEMY